MQISPQQKRETFIYELVKNYQRSVHTHGHKRRKRARARFVATKCTDLYEKSVDNSLLSHQ